MLEAMVDCAYRLGMTLSEMAKAETCTPTLVKLTDAFWRSFQAVRLGIRLSMTLRAPPKPAVATAPQRAKAPEVEAPEVEALEVEALEVEAPEVEALEVERTDTAERLDRPDSGMERERDRDDEPVSLSRFLATLGVVATSAERLADRLPASVTTQTLPALRHLLAQAKADPPASRALPGERPSSVRGEGTLALRRDGTSPAAAAALTRPRPPAAKASLLGSAAALPAAAPRPRPLAFRSLARPPPRPPG